MTDLFAPLLHVAISGLLEGAIYSLIGIGIGLIIGVMRIINYTHGDLMIFAAFINFWMFSLLGLDPFLTLAISVPVTFGAGVFIQKFIVGPAISRVEFQTSASLIVTYGLALLIFQSEFIFWTPNMRRIQTPYTGLTIGSGDFTFNLMRVLGLVIAVAVAVGLSILLSKTNFGKAMRACTQDREAAMIMGVNFDKTAYLTFGLSAIVAALAGLLYIITHVLNPGYGITFTIKGFIVLLFGGMGSMYGPLLAGLIIGLAENLGAFTFGGLYKDTIAYLILLIILLVRPRGILGRVEV